MISITRDGTPWRPLVHVLNICKAITCALEAPREAIHDEAFPRICLYPGNLLN